MSLFKLLRIVGLVVGLCFLLWYYLPGGDEPNPATKIPKDILETRSRRQTKPKPDPKDDPKYILALASKHDEQSAGEMIRLLAVHARRSWTAELLQRDTAYQVRKRACPRLYRVRQEPCHLFLVQRVLSQTTNPHIFDLLLKNLNSHEDSIVTATAEVLGLIGDSRAAKPLYACYRNKKRIKKRYSRIRDAVKFAMSRFDIKVVLPILKPCLTNSTSFERYETLDILAYIAPVEAVDVFIELFNDGTTAIREKASEALVTIGKPAVPALLKAMKHPKLSVVLESIKTLGKIPDPRCAAALTKALNNKYYYIARAAKKALKTLKETNIQVENTENAASTTPACETIGSPTVTALLPVLRHSNTRERIRALRIISYRKSDPRVFDLLMKATSDPNKDIRNVATTSLGNLKNKKAIHYLLKTLENSDINIRNRAERSLVDLLEPSHIPTLVRLLKSQNHASPHAANLLGEIGTPATWPPIWEALCLSNEHTSRQAARALKKHVTKADISKLDKALKSPHKHVRRDIVVLYNKIGGKEVVKPLLVLLRDKDISVSCAAANANVFRKTDDYSMLWPLFNQAVRATGEKRYKSWRGSCALPKLVARDIKPFVKLLQSKNRPKRRMAAYLLSKTNNKKAYAELRQCVKKHDLDITLSCYWIFNDPELSKGLEDYLIDVMHNHGGGYDMAKCYLNSRNPKLSDASESWGHKHGYTVTRLSIPIFTTHTNTKKVSK
ncbi:MAG: HEAT repeat domain-containing protein [Phycisphaerae bacterium]|nr:HEAT repeat domain-containing protein [Phycisphaerae bacterium]